MSLPEELIAPLLRARRLTLVTAESCTGGLIANRITDVPGSSDYFLGGMVAYDNRIKICMLGVPPGLLAQYGAVSRETVQEMAAGARTALGADIAISVSGVAGPGGGTPKKPVGTLWIGLAAPDGIWARRCQFSGNRVDNKSASAEAALQFLLEYLAGKLAEE